MLQLERTVLIIDDSLVERETYRRYLLQETGFAYTLWEAESASSALRLCDRQLPDSIVLDYLLPDMDGLEFLAELQHRFSPCPPVVMLTGYEDVTVAVKAIKIGAEDYLVKQKLTPGELGLAVRSAITNAELRRQIQQCDKLFRTSVENMQDCFGIFSAIRDETGQIIDFRFDYLNAAALESNRMTQADLGKRMCEVFPAHHESGLFAEYCQVVETGQPLAKEALEYSDRFGDQYLTRAYDIRVSKLNDGFVASWRDITERKRTELERDRYAQQCRRLSIEAEQARQQAEESERRFRAIFDATFQFIGLLNPEGILLEANQTALDFGGLTHEDVLNRPFWEARWWTISPQTQAQLRDAIAQAAQGEFVRYEVEVLGAGDRVITIDFSLKPVRDESGQVVLLIPEGRDISDRIRYECDHKRSEAELRTYQAQLQLAMQSAQMGFWDFNLITQESVWSPEAKQLLGLPIDWQQCSYEILQRRIYPDDRGLVDHAITEAIEVGSYAIEFRVVWDDGSIHWLADRGQAFYDETGRAVRLMGMATDITDRKITVLTLQQANDRFEIAAAAVNCIIYDWDLQKDTVERTRGLYEVTGYLVEEADLSSQWWFDLIHPDDRSKKSREKVFAELIELDRYCVEYRLRHKNGHYIWVEDRGRIIKNDQGQPVRIVGSTADISDRKQTEAALQQSEERYRSLTELIPQLVWTANAEGIILDVNQRWLDFTGFTLEQIQIAGWQAIVHPEDLPLLNQAWAAAQQDGSYYQAEGRIRRADGTYRWYLHQAISLKNEQGQIIKWFGTATDIENQKQLEQQRDRLYQQAQAAQAEAEAANRSKDEFIAIVAHELRSPLNSVMGWAKMLQSRTFDAATTAKALETIVRNTEAQVQLIDDLLDISRMIRGKLNLALSPVNLVNVIEAVLEVVRPMAAAKQIQLETRIQAVGRMSGDFNRLQQIAINLLTNAIKFTPVEGRVEVVLEAIDTQACLQICDTGKGIAPEFLPHIFERFQQAQKNASPKDGLGLGLAIAKHLVELHSGTITVVSEGVGQGATFTVMLPLLEAEGRKQKGENQPDTSFNTSSLPLAGIRILAVDDEPDSLEMLRFTLEEFGGVVESVTTATTVLELLPQFQPDILLCDIAMPEINGYELLQKIRQLDTGQMPAIAVTAYASLADREKSLQAGFEQHFSKPVEPEALVAAILNLVSPVV
jgi:PAS domain S-box-containing protein